MNENHVDLRLQQQIMGRDGVRDGVHHARRLGHRQRPAGQRRVGGLGGVCRRREIEVLHEEPIHELVVGPVRRHSRLSATRQHAEGSRLSQCSREPAVGKDRLVPLQQRRVPIVRQRREGRGRRRHHVPRPC